MNPNKIGGIILIILGLTYSFFCTKNVLKRYNRSDKEIEADANAFYAYQRDYNKQQAEDALKYNLKIDPLYNEEEITKNINKRIAWEKEFPTMGVIIILLGIVVAIGGVFVFKSKYFIATLQKNGIIKKVSTGYSWKSLFFGIFYPMARGDMKGIVIQLILCIVTIGTSWLVVPFVYNKRYITRLIEEGYTPYDETSEHYLKEHLIYSINKTPIVQ